MKGILVVALLIAVSAAVAITQTGADQGTKAKENSSVEQQLLQMERDWTQANLKRDVTALDRILADDWIGQSKDGSQNKAQAIADYKTGDFKLDSVTPISR